MGERDDVLLYSELLVLVLACAAAAGCLLLVACHCHWNWQWREEIQNRNRLLEFGGKKFKIEIDSSIWREEIQNRHSLRHRHATIIIFFFFVLPRPRYALPTHIPIRGTTNK